MHKKMLILWRKPWRFKAIQHEIAQLHMSQMRAADLIWNNTGNCVFVFGKRSANTNKKTRWWEQIDSSGLFSSLPPAVLCGADLQICLQRKQQTGRGKVSPWGSGDVTDTEAQGANICHLQLGMAAAVLCFIDRGWGGASLYPRCAASELLQSWDMWVLLSIITGSKTAMFLFSMQKQLCPMMMMMMYVCLCVRGGGGDQWMKEGRNAACQMNSDRGLRNGVGVLWYF